MKILKHKIIYILIFALLLHIAVLFVLKASYNINSDDIAYVKSGIKLYETGQFCLNNVISAQAMPGISVIIAIIVSVFKTEDAMWIAIKLLWIFMSIFAIYNVYRIIKLFANENLACIGALFMCTLDFAYTANLALIEVPLMLSYTVMFYHALKYAKFKKKTDFAIMMLAYLCGVYLRPEMIAFPLFFALYLLIKKFTLKQTVKHFVIMLLILCVAIAPWAIRNARVFNEFIPLTNGAGNPKLLGTYEGIGYPQDFELDYEKNVMDKLTESEKQILKENDPKNHMLKHVSLKLDNIKANYRMGEWLKRSPHTFLFSYLIFKPVIMLCGAYYKVPLFNVPYWSMILLRSIDSLLFIVLGIYLLKKKKNTAEVYFLGGVYVFTIFLHSIGYAMDRYAQSMFFFKFIIIGIGLYWWYQIKKKTG